MTRQENIGRARRVLSIGLAGATLATVLTYVLGAQAILQSPYAEPGHQLFMSIYAPLVQGMTGGHGAMSQMHGGQASGSQMQSTMGLIGNNMMGSPAGPAAAGFGAVVVMGTIALAGAAFAVSWRQRSFLVAGLLATSGAALMALPLANMNLAVPGPIIGVVVGLGVLGLGAAKAIWAARTAVVATR